MREEATTQEIDATEVPERAASGGAHTVRTPLHHLRGNLELLAAFEWRHLSGQGRQWLTETIAAVATLERALEDSGSVGASVHVEQDQEVEG